MDQVGIAICTICNGLLDGETGVAVVGKMGIHTFIQKSKLKGDDKWKLWEDQDKVKFHDKCRKRYAASSDRPSKKRKVSDESSFDTNCVVSQPSTSFTQPHIYNSLQFDFKDLCIICTKSIDRKNNKVHSLSKNNNHLIECAIARNDEYGEDILNRLDILSTLHSVTAYYHLHCMNAVKSTKKIGRNIPKEQVAMMFANVANYIENEGKLQYHLQELREVMGENFLNNNTLIKKLKEKYNDDIIIEQHRGKQPVFFYRSPNIMELSIDWLSNPDSLSNHQKNLILRVAGQIVVADIKKQDYNYENYPPSSKFLDSTISEIPESLKTLLFHLLDSKCSTRKDVKRDTIAHSIISIVRPRTFISKFQLAVGTYIYRKTGSRLIIDMMSKLGVSASYHNIQLYEASVIMQPAKLTHPNSFIQFVFDNTDHNVSTLDGHETFHCLGGIKVITPEYDVEYEGGSKRLTEMPPASILASQKQIKLIPFSYTNPDGLKGVEFVDISKLYIKVQPEVPKSYVAYLCAKSLEIENIPTWRGFHETLSRDVTYTMSHVNCLPFINAPPSSLTTLHTALLYAVEETKRNKCRTTFVTFDQPLYFKANSIIVQSDNPDFRNIAVRLGGFHLLMSYMGAIGFIMDGSGLKDLWATSYAAQSVKKMSEGHAFSRALRAHILTFTAIGIHILKTSNISATDAIEIQMKMLFENWKENSPTLGDCNIDPMVVCATQKFEETLHDLLNHGPTAKLWIQYLKSVIILLQFVEAERIGDWDLHLSSVRKMLPLFHASGHFAYAKSAQWYLQDMVHLETTMDPLEFDRFTKEGYFTIRRTDKAWSGVWSDMCIEQTLNRFFGTDLRHGRGVTPSVVARYLLGMPSAFDVMECLEEYADLRTANSEQHVDLSESRMKRDKEDIEKFVFWLKYHNPFEKRDCLMSLSTGVIGSDHINCHMAFEEGRKGMEAIVGKKLWNMTLSSKFKVRNLCDSQNEIRIPGGTSSIDSSALLQRMLVLYQNDESRKKEAISYELSPYPLSLFDEYGLMRKTVKSDLYKLFSTHLQSQSLLTGMVYVIDGGWLLHQVVWPHSKRFVDVLEIYRLFILKKFGQNCKIVFDGYSDEIIGIKSYERFRRKEKVVAPDVQIDEDKMVTMTQKKFLSNIGNKYKFIKILSNYLRKHNIEVKVAEEDADVDIVMTAISLKENIPESVAVVGNDVDLFVLLIALTPDHSNIFFYKVVPGSKGNTLYSTYQDRELKPFILFAHAFAGCDSTSAMYNQGKKKIIRLLQRNPDLQESVKIFYQEDKSIRELYPIAEKIVKYLYNTSGGNLSIDELRYKIFTTPVLGTRKTSPLVMLPPTESALIEHTRRVYYQIQVWLGRLSLKPEHWGWHRSHCMLIPKMMTKAVAPQELLNNVFCSCNGKCDTSRCSCQKAGLKCTRFCKMCNGITCENVSDMINRLEINSDVDEDEWDPDDAEGDDIDAFVRVPTNIEGREEM